VSLVPITSRFPASCMSPLVCSHDANSATAVAPTLVTTAFSSRACPLLSRKLHPLPLPRVVPAGLEHRSQNKVFCPVIAFPAADHNYKTDPNMKDVFQPSPHSRLRVFPPPTAQLGVQTQNHPCCITVKHFQSPAFVSFQAGLQAEERKRVKRKQNG